MNDQFIFFCTNVGNENLLKEEIRVFYPELTLSYSRKGFITFKNKGVKYDINTISQLEVAFSTRSGICLGKAKPEELKGVLTKCLADIKVDVDKCIVHSFSVNTEYEFDHELGTEVNEYSPINKTVIDLIALGDKEVWIGIHKVGKNTTNYPNSNPGIDLVDDSPSRAWLKLAQSINLFNINIDKTDTWLDFGSAPGGSSHFLLEQGVRVWGVDPAKMSDQIMNHPKYKHFSIPVQDLSQEDLPDRINWINVEININPKQAIKEVLRLCKKYNFTLKGIVFTIQIVKIDQVKNIENFEDHFFEWGFENIVSCQIPSHKQEYVIIAKR